MDNVENEGKIDTDVVDVMKEQDVLKALSDDTQIKRFILNCFCEFLSEIKNLRTEVNNLVNTITICSTDKLKSFFKELETNVKTEEKRIELQEKIHESHKKPSKTKKNLTNVIKFPKNSVK